MPTEASFTLLVWARVSSASWVSAAEARVLEQASFELEDEARTNLAAVEAASSNKVWFIGVNVATYKKLDLSTSSSVTLLCVEDLKRSASAAFDGEGDSAVDLAGVLVTHGGDSAGSGAAPLGASSATGYIPPLAAVAAELSAEPDAAAEVQE